MAASIVASTGVTSAAESLLSAALYTQTREYIKEQIEQFGYGGLSRGFALVITAASLLVTIWLILQGWRIVTEQSRDSMKGFIIRSIQVVLVMAIAQGAAIFGKDLVGSINGIKDMVSLYVTGSTYSSPENMIDATLLAMSALQEQLTLYASQETTLNNGLGNGLNFITGMGQAVPALVSGGLLLLNQIALSLCLVFAPLFIVCYLFEVSRPFFNTWAKFTVTTLFSLAVLTVIITIAMKAILVVSATILAADITSGGTLVLRDIATAQGGLGMLMTTLILGGPPLVTNFFSGAVTAGFNAYNNIGNMAGTGNTGGNRPAGGPQDMVANAGTGANTQQNSAGGVDPNITAGEKKLLGTNQAAASPNNDGVRPVEQARLAVNRSDAGGSYSTGAPSSAGSAAANAATNVAEERAFAAQKAQQSGSTTATTANYAATNTASSTTASGSNAASTTATGNTNTAPASTSSNDSTVRLANTGMGDDSIALNQKYGSRGLNSPNRTTV